MPNLRSRLDAMMGGRSKPPPISLTLGMKFAEVGEGKATMTMNVGRRFHNPMGTLHGGIITDLADAAMGTATFSTLKEGEVFTTLELKMNFLRPVISGRITAEGTVLHRGKTIILAEVVVKDEAGKMVAKGMATQMIIKTHEGTGAKPRRERPG